MFFFGIFGIESKEKEIRYIQNVICKACGSMTTYRLIKVYSFFHFFFIPLFRWGETYYIEARCCGAIFEVDREKGRELERGEDIPLTDANFRQINSNNYNHANGETICQSCGKRVDNSYSYCPYCGNRIK